LENCYGIGAYEMVGGGRQKTTSCIILQNLEKLLEFFKGSMSE